MAEPQASLAVAFAMQAALGTMDPTLAALHAGGGAGTAGALNLSNGIVLGDPGSGVRGTGIDFTFERGLSEKANISGSFTTPLSDFIERRVQVLQFAFPYCGPRFTPLPNPPIDGNFEHKLGIKAILASGGLVGALRAGAPIGWRYGLATVGTGGVTLASAKIWSGKDASNNTIEYLFRDIISSIDIDYTDGAVPIARAKFSGVFVSASLQTFPAFEYEEQASISAPPVRTIGFSWNGMTGGFAKATLSIDNAIQSVPDCNIANRFRPNGRTVTFKGDVKVDAALPAQPIIELARTSTSGLTPITFQVGSAGVAGGVALAHQINMPQPELISFKGSSVADLLVHDVEIRARHTVADQELELINL